MRGKRAGTLLTLLTLLTVLGVAGAFPLNTNTGRFEIATSGVADWNAFTWKWSGRDTQYLSCTTDQDVSDGAVYLRLTRAYDRTLWLDAGPVSVGSGTNLTLSVSSSNVPPAGIYLAELLLQNAGSYRTLARGRVERTWGTIEATTLGANTPWVQATNNAAYLGGLPPAYFRNWPNMTNTSAVAAATLGGYAAAWFRNWANITNVTLVPRVLTEAQEVAGAAHLGELYYTYLTNGAGVPASYELRYKPAHTNFEVKKVTLGNVGW